MLIPFYQCLIFACPIIGKQEHLAVLIDRDTATKESNRKKQKPEMVMNSQSAASVDC